MSLHHPARAGPLLLLLWAGTSASPAWALDRNRSLGRHALVRWSSTEGLPSNNVEAVAQTPDGLLWFATNSGLSRLEGKDFRTWTQRDLPGTPPLRGVTLVAGSTPGELWLGTADDGLLQLDYHTGSHRLLREADGLCDDKVLALATDQDGTLWIGSDNALACSYREGQFQRYPLPAEGGSRIFDIATDKNGGVYMATGSGGLVHTPSKGVALDILGGLPGRAMVVEVDADDAIFVGTAEHGVFQYHFDTGRYQPIAAQTLGSATITGLERDDDGVLWVGTNNDGLYRVRLDSPEIAIDRDHIGLGTISDLLVDSEDSLWATTIGGGVARLADQRIYTIAARHGLAHEDVRSVAPHPNGGAYIGTAGGGIYRLLGDRAEPLLPPGNPVEHAQILSLATGRDGTLWASAYGLGLARIQGEQVDLLGPDQGLASSRPAAVLEDSEGGIWIGHYNGDLDRLMEGSLQRWGMAEGLPGRVITAILQRRDGSIVLGTRGRGAFTIEGGHLAPLSAKGDLGGQIIHAIRETSNGALWLATDSGLTRLAKGEAITIGREQGLSANAVHDLVDDRSGNLWLCTDRGIVALDRTSLASMVLGQTGQVPARLFDRDEGMRTEECSWGNQPGIIKDQGGNTIYAATSLGLVVVETSRSFEPPPPPRAFIDRLVVDGVTLAPGDTGGRLRLGRGSVDLEASFLDSSNLHPTLLRYRYRLLGLHEDWIETTGPQTLRYYDLGPGHYQLELQASTDGSWDSPVTQRQLSVGSLPWQWVWAWVLLALGAFTGLWTIQRRRLARTAEQQRQLEAKLDAKARELRDAALVDPLTGLRNRRFVMEVVLPEVVAFITQKVQIQQSGPRRRSTAETGVYGVFLFDVDHFKKINDTLGHEAGDRMLQQFSYLLRRSVRQDDFVVRWGGEEFLVVLRFSDREHLDHYARRVREQVERTTFLVSEASGGALKKTASLGYVSLPFFDEQPSLLEFEHALLMADQALYFAKEGGRNRAVRAVSTGKVPQPSDLQRMVRDLGWAIDNGFVRLETFAPSD